MEGLYNVSNTTNSSVSLQCEPASLSGPDALESIVTALALTTLILLTVVGNVLVILSVFTYKPLRIVQNFFIVSLAVADLTVAVLVLPLNVTYSLAKRWLLGIHICKLWLTCDVLCCTASILNLCAIALDRYWAITDPINYAQKRTVRRVLLIIAGVWLLSLLISSPPLLGWNDWPAEFDSHTPCQLTSQQGYVVYSSLGSFYIPLFIMALVYFEIFLATRRRLRERAKASAAATRPALQANDAESLSSDGENGRAKRGTKYHRKKGSVERKRGCENNRVHDVSSCVKVPCTVQPVYQFIEERQKISLSKERRAARTLGIIMGVFVVCWLPFFLMYVIVPFCPACCPDERLVNFITWLGYLNSALNPIIYTIFNIDFRRAFSRLLNL
ncbi:UNVERIFIED_CONTAM: hypothetical protein B566_EDAN019231 [Ephemera danica]|nr:hypothetical protein B566_EDAN019231 [Ephemera danica]